MKSRFQDFQAYLEGEGLRTKNLVDGNGAESHAFNFYTDQPVEGPLKGVCRIFANRYDADVTLNLAIEEANGIRYYHRVAEKTEAWGLAGDGIAMVFGIQAVR